MISAEDFEKVRGEICASGPASDGANLLGMQIDFCAYLGDPALPRRTPGCGGTWKVIDLTAPSG